MATSETYEQVTLFTPTSSWAAFPVRTCPLPDAGRAWMESGADFGSSSVELLETFARAGWLSRMSLAFYPATADGTLPSSFAGWSNAGMASPGGFLTHSFSEFPNDAAVCSLSEVLETEAQPRYFLSPRACLGILRRAKNRGKTLPRQLQAALTTVAYGDANQEAQPAS